MIKLIIILCILLCNFNLLANEYRFKNKRYTLGKLTYPIHENTYNDSDDKVVNLISELNLKSWQSSVKDQGERGSCTFFTVTALMEGALKKYLSTDFDINLSEEYLIWYTKSVLRVKQNKDSGSIFHNLYSLGQGMMFERDMPFNSNWFEDGLPCQGIEWDIFAPHYCFSHYPPEEGSRKLQGVNFDFKYLTSNPYEIAKFMQETHTTVAMGVPIYNPHWNDETGVVAYDRMLNVLCRQNPEECGAHSILLTGFDSKREVFYFKNSWSDTWGNKGYGEVPFKFIKKFAMRGTISFTNLKVKKFPVPLPLPTAKISKVVHQVARSAEIINLKNYFKVSYLKGSAGYISAYLVKKSGENYSYLKDDHGNDIKTGRWFVLREDEISFLQNPLELNLTYLKPLKDIYLKVRIYQTTDTNTFLNLSEKYIKLQ